MRLGEEHISFVITDKSGNDLYELAYCSVECKNDDKLTDFFIKYPSLNQSFYQVLIAYDFSKSILSPSKVFQMDGSQLALESLYGITPGSQMITELIPDWQINNSYSVPEEIIKWVKEKFPSAITTHQNTLAMKNIQAAGQDGFILIDFRKDDFTMIVAGNSRILLAQSFQYKIPGDVVYYLLKSCSQNSLSQNDVKVQLTGLIEKESSLYRELYQYFIHLDFREAAWKSTNEFPAHYFTSLNDLAQCAS